MTISKPELEYSPPISWHRRRRVRRCYVIALLSIVCLLAVCSSGPLGNELHYLRLRWQLGRMTLPADKVVFETDPLKANVLLQRDQYRFGLGGTPATQPVVASWVPMELTEFVRSAG